ncbi:helix-turn-helix domain-containing protein [Clostridium sp. D53t1_180928_C8]|uniref:helix-turn-helix domain-containing protein n=1 Tax=Clostridium sp. D53t1_180928_C8 TaxID=2787101 RepID=UPI0018AC85FF
MKCIERLIKDVYDSSNIPFQLIIDGVGVYSSSKFKIKQRYIRKRSDYRDIKYTIIVSEEYKLVVDLLKSYLENKFDEIIIKKDALIIALLDEKKIDDEVIEIVWPELNKSFELISIFLSEYSNRVYESIKKEYLNSKLKVVLYNNNIVIIGKNRDVLEEAQNIKEKIDNLYLERFYITYCKISDYKGLKSAYNETLYRLKLANKYNIKDIIFDDKKLILEGLIDSISEEIKERISNDVNSKISKLDNEMIRTIEVFFQCGLNLSDSAKELYIHRNTLIYRLDKIQKVTSYDIREFDNAMIFKIIFLYIGRKSNLTVEKV